MQCEVLNQTKEKKLFRKNYMIVGVKNLLRAGMMPARTWRAHAVGMSPTERLKWKLQQAIRVRLHCPCLWRHTPWKWKKSSLPWLLSAGQKEYGQEKGVTSKNKFG